MGKKRRMRTPLSRSRVNRMKSKRRAPLRRAAFSRNSLRTKQPLGSPCPSPTPYQQSFLEKGGVPRGAYLRLLQPTIHPSLLFNQVLPISPPDLCHTWSCMRVHLSKQMLNGEETSSGGRRRHTDHIPSCGEHRAPPNAPTLDDINLPLFLPFEPSQNLLSVFKCETRPFNLGPKKYNYPLQSLT